MVQGWSERPKENRYIIVGAIIGMAVAAVVAFVFAFEADTIVRYLIMAAGLLIGLFGGKWLASR